MIVDVGEKFVKVESMEGEDRPVALIEYRENPEDRRVMTGPFLCLPHLDPYETGVELLYSVRGKYPEGDWILETEPAWCARPEYLAMINRGIDDGHVFYDDLGEYIPDHPGLLNEWEYRDFAFVNPDGEMPTRTIWQALARVQEEIDADA